MPFTSGLEWIKQCEWPKIYLTIQGPVKFIFPIQIRCFPFPFFYSVLMIELNFNNQRGCLINLNFLKLEQYFKI